MRVEVLFAFAYLTRHPAANPPQSTKRHRSESKCFRKQRLTSSPTAILRFLPIVKHKLKPLIPDALKTVTRGCFIVSWFNDMKIKCSTSKLPHLNRLLSNSVKRVQRLRHTRNPISCSPPSKKKKETIRIRGKRRFNWQI